MSHRVVVDSPLAAELNVTPIATPPPRHIHSRVFDLVCFSIGWLPVFLAFVLTKEGALSDGIPRTVIETDAGKAILLFILVVNFVHRHITFPLVYGDRQVFEARRRRYVLLPLAFLGLTLVAAGMNIPADVVGAPVRLSASGTTQKEHTLTFYLSTDGRSKDATGKMRSNKRKAKIAMGSTLEDVAKAIEAATSPRDDGARSLTTSVESPGTNQAALRFVGTPKWFAKSGTQWFAIRADRSAQKELGLGQIVLVRRHRAKQPLMSLLVALSVMWTIYHTLMQKMGILRIYSRVAGAGDARLDRAFVFVWFVAMVAHLAARDDVRATASRVSSVGQMVRPLFDAIAPALVFAQWGLLLVAVGVTLAWFNKERTAGQIHRPRLVFAASLLALYVTFTYDLVIGFATLAFSHSLEYIAFVGVFTARKYAKVDEDKLPWVGKRARVPLRSIVLFAVMTTTVFVIFRNANRDWLDIYIVGSSFLHFLYDGWLWKVRKPEVQKHL